MRKTYCFGELSLPPSSSFARTSLLLLHESSSAPASVEEDEMEEFGVARLLLLSLAGPLPSNSDLGFPSTRESTSEEDGERPNAVANEL